MKTIRYIKRNSPLPDCQTGDAIAGAAIGNKDNKTLK